MTDVTEDAFLGGRVMITQPKRGYRAGIDAVFLAASAPCRPGARVLDVGAGVGTVGLCLAARVHDVEVVLLEREAELAALARGNIEANKLSDRVRVVNAAIEASAEVFAAAGLKPDSFDVVLANPPFHAEGRGTPAPDPLKAASHAMAEASLDTWVRFLARMAKPGGFASMIHKAEALPEVLAAFTGRFGDIRVRPMHPRAGEAAIRVIVQGTKGSRAPLVLLAGYNLHGEGNAFTEGAQMVLRDGAGSPLVTQEDVRRL